ncbi:hypothetical protein C0W54_08530 [Photobacterium kishitanii]|uniref:hypothetical protein n=1 Tax=Photobacterium kishitanii TaxID=318456 RepID=UPI000D15DA7D|nr:hypothetical protein [Photobacterium kishitanii]PSW61878.1 hypothetical protein C0W54_08530 [Photobacterium kishitanii]
MNLKINKIITLSIIFFISGCATSQPNNMRSNSTLEWADGLTERALVPASKRTISVPFGKSVYVFSIDESTIGNDCLKYTYRGSIGLATADVCYGNELTLYLNSNPLNSGTIILDNGDTFNSIRLSKEQLRKREANKKAALIILKQKQEQYTELEKVKNFTIDQQKRRIEAETIQFEIHSQKTSDKIDAENDTLRSIGKGVENHGIK